MMTVTLHLTNTQETVLLCLINALKCKMTLHIIINMKKNQNNAYKMTELYSQNNLPILFIGVNGFYICNVSLSQLLQNYLT